MSGARQLEFDEKRWADPMVLAPDSLYRYLFVWTWGLGPTDLPGEPFDGEAYPEPESA